MLVLVAVVVAVAVNSPSGASELRSATAPAGDSSTGAPAKALGVEEPITNHAPTKTTSIAAAKMNLFEEEENNAQTFREIECLMR